MLGGLGLKIPLRFWLLNGPWAVTTVIIKQAPDRGWCRWLASLPAAGSAGWVAAWLSSSRDLHWAPAGLLLRFPRLRWSTAGCGLRWFPAGLFLALLVSRLLLGSLLGCLQLDHLLLGCLLGCSRLFAGSDLTGLSAQLRELLFS